VTSSTASFSGLEKLPPGGRDRGNVGVRSAPVANDTDKRLNIAPMLKQE
jgi:hypothetical protein